MEILNKEIKDLNPKALKAFKEEIVNRKPFKIQHIKEWFGGQKVHIIANEYKGLKEFPSDLEGKAGAAVLNLLDRVWLDKGEVAEGILSDLLHGCIKDPKGFMSALEARDRIENLRNLGYIDFSDEQGNLGYQAWANLPIAKVWFRLTPKFEKLLIAVTL